jgi:hypothetical protein
MTGWSDPSASEPTIRVLNRRSLPLPSRLDDERENSILLLRNMQVETVRSHSVALSGMNDSQDKPTRRQTGPTKARGPRQWHGPLAYC